MTGVDEPVKQSQGKGRAGLHCDVCGYDLHGNTSRICPECGAPAPRTNRMPPDWWMALAICGVAIIVLLLMLAVPFLAELSA